MTQAHSDIVGLSCAILKDEIQELQRQGVVTIPFKFLPSMLHMYPMKLGKRVSQDVEATLQKKQKRVLLVYGDCSDVMMKLERGNSQFARTKARSCCELLLGREEYNQYMHDRVFMLMPEWVQRWKDVFKHQLALKGETVSSFMQEMHSRFVYLDSGLKPTPQSCLDEMSDYFGLPYEIRHIGLEQLELKIIEAMERLESGNV